MICFSNRRLIQYRCDGKEAELRNVLLKYYENIEEDAIIVIYNKKGSVVGWTSYQDLLEKEEYIISRCFYADPSMWDNASDDKRGVVLDQQEKPLAFCYEADVLTEYEHRYFIAAESMRKEYPGNFLKAYPDIKQIYLVGLNEYTWRAFQMFKDENMPVTVLGEEWAWFGITSAVGNIHSVEKSAFIFADRKYSENQELIGYNYILHWSWEIAKQVYKEELERLKEKGIAVCKVKFPSTRENIKVENWPKSDLLNCLRPLDINGLSSSDEATKNRQINFFGMEVYNKLVNQQSLNDGEWEKVVFQSIKVEKIKGKKFKNKVYLVGPCLVENLYALAKNSVVAELQKLVSAYDYEVVRAVIPRDKPDVFKMQLGMLPLRKKDIVICLNYDNYFYEDDNLVLDMSELFNRQRSETWIGDGALMHLNAAGNKAVAQELFNSYLNSKCKELSWIHEENNTYIQEGTLVDEVTKECINKYIASVRAIEPIENRKIGCIVMNCNPFTKGHQFLIEAAAGQVDFLYVFVVEENRSFFPFEVRMELVKRGTEHLSNVFVVSSGNWIISYDTFPVYFEKTEKQDVQMDASTDLEIFARYIAPGLNISSRFVGEEPTDLITRQYNEQMKDLLPRYGIELIEIPRKLSDDKQVISASRVRRLLGEREWLGINELVPETTYDFLHKLYSCRLVVYGAGMWGKRVHDRLMKLGCNVVGWFDKNHRNFAEEMHVKAPSELNQTECDYVLVAVESMMIFEEIRKFLCESLNVEKEKIFGPVTVLSQLFWKML